LIEKEGFAMEKRYLKKKIFFGLSITLILMVAMSSLSINAVWAEQKISLATGGTGGTWYPTGGMIADICNKNITDVTITAEVTSGSAENLKLVAAKKVELLFVNGLAAYRALNGVKPYFNEKVTNFRSMFYVHPGTGHLVVLKKSGIRNRMDLKDKRIATGSPTSNLRMYAKAIFKAYGFSDKDIQKMERKWVYQSYSEAIKALKDGRIDAAMVYAGMPTSSVMDVATTHAIDLIGLSKEVQDQLVKDYPFFIQETIPADTYKGVDKDVAVVSTASIVCAEEEFSPDIVYQVIKTVHKNQKKLAEGHKAFKRWQFIPQVDNLVKLHEGAKRYYKEIGLLK
jgi:TRAP transporter TAXI family solute receptor